MQTVIIIAMIVFAAVSIVAILASLLAKGRQSSPSCAPSVENELQVLKSDNAENQKAKAFISLMRKGYVLIHTMGNHGENFDDRKHTISFCNSLSDSVVKKFQSMDETYK